MFAAWKSIRAAFRLSGRCMSHRRLLAQSAKSDRPIVPRVCFCFVRFFFISKRRHSVSWQDFHCLLRNYTWARNCSHKTSVSAAESLSWDHVRTAKLENIFTWPFPLDLHIYCSYFTLILFLLVLLSVVCFDRLMKSSNKKLKKKSLSDAVRRVCFIVIWVEDKSTLSEKRLSDYQRKSWDFNSFIIWNNQTLQAVHRTKRLKLRGQKSLFFCYTKTNTD